MKRRNFIKYVGAGSIAATTLHPSLVMHPKERISREQFIHHDYQSNNPGTEYFFLGNGFIIAAIQKSDVPGSGTHCGMLLMSSERFGRKVSTFLFHPERGLENSRLYMGVDDDSYSPAVNNATIIWEYPDSIPTLVIGWDAGVCKITEKLFCPVNEPAVIRKVSVRNTGPVPVAAHATLLLHPNLILFDEYDVDRNNMMLTAIGYHRVRLFSDSRCTVGDRHMRFELGSIPTGKEREFQAFLTVDFEREKFESKSSVEIRSETAHYWNSKATFNSSHEKLNHLFRCAQSGIRAAVSRSGKMDGSVWQYNLEWVRDQSMVAVGSCMNGLTDVAETLIRRMLEHSVDEEGGTVESSRFRPPETMELDQNGALLYTIWTHWVWTGKDTIMKQYWDKIKKVADYVLQPVFRDPEIGLLKNSREYWERNPSFGVEDGYELTYQFWNILGLDKASVMAEYMGESDDATRWKEASDKMNRAFTAHPTLSLVEDGRFIKRRLPDGSVQRTFEPPNRNAMPSGMPLNVESVSYCDPDSSSALPIAWGLVDPKSELSLNTLQSLEHLWNQRWSFGGYARYDVTSEPDSPGPWPFATMFITRAYHEAENYEKVWRSLDWLLSVQGARAGSWYEFYGDRPTPPLPPVGIVVWTWGELSMFFVHHMLGIRPNREKVQFRPRLLPGVDSVAGTSIIHGHEISYMFQRTDKDPYALIDGREEKLMNGVLNIPVPVKDITIEIYIQ
jgi:hypothetical protein